MNITLTITGGTAAEIQQAVQDLLNSFAIGAKGELLELKTAEPIKKPKQNTVPNTLLDKPAADLTTSSEGSDTEQEHTIESVRAAANEKAESGKRQEVKALITSFDGAKNINSLDAKYYPEFIEKLKAL